MNKTAVKTWILPAFIVAALVFFDQMLKIWAVANMKGQPGRVLIRGFLGLTYTENTGAAFGFLSGFEWSSVFFTIFKIVVLIGITWYYARIPQEKKYWALRIPIVLIFAGGVGNLIDRFLYGHVVDMLAFLFINFPIFNLADVYVTAGCFIGAFVALFVIRDLP